MRQLHGKKVEEKPATLVESFSNPARQIRSRQKKEIYGCSLFLLRFVAAEEPEFSYNYLLRKSHELKYHVVVLW